MKTVAGALFLTLAFIVFVSVLDQKQVREDVTSKALEGGDENFVELADATDQAARKLGWYGGYSHGGYMNGDGGDGGSNGGDEEEDEVFRPNGGSTSSYMSGGGYSEYDNGGDMDEEDESPRPGYGSRGGGGGGSYSYSSGYHGYHSSSRGRSYSYSHNYRTNYVRPAKVVYTEPIVVHEPVVVESHYYNYHGGKGKGWRA